MKRARAILLLGLAAVHAAAHGAETVAICYNYGCITQAQIRYSDAQLAAVRQLLAGATDAARERMRVALAIGLLYSWAGRQSPIHNDRGGDYADDAADGRMDCIDHAQSTTHLLRMLAARGWLRFHDVLEPVRRTRFMVAQHFSAVVEERTSAAAAASAKALKQTPVGDKGSAARFAIDTWYFENGMPAVVLPLDDWMNGAGPDV